MKTLARLVLLSLVSSFAVSTVSAAGHTEPARVNFTVAKTSVLTSRMATAIKTVGELNLSERLVLTPRLTKGGASVRLNLNF